MKRFMRRAWIAPCLRHRSPMRLSSSWNVRDMPNRSIERPLLARIQSLPGAREVEIDAAVIATGLGIAPAQPSP